MLKFNSNSISFCFDYDRFALFLLIVFSRHLAGEIGEEYSIRMEAKKEVDDL